MSADREAKAAHNKSIPSGKLIEYDSPEKVDVFLKEAKAYNCIECKIFGSGAFICLAAYVYLSGRYHIRTGAQSIIRRTGNKNSPRNRMIFVRGLSSGLAGLGVWRAWN